MSLLFRGYSSDGLRFTAEVDREREREDFYPQSTLLSTWPPCSFF